MKVKIKVILAILVLGGIGRSHHKIKVLEKSVVSLEETIELQREAITLLQGNLEIIAIDLYGEPKK